MGTCDDETIALSTGFCLPFVSALVSLMIRVKVMKLMISMIVLFNREWL